MLQEAVVACGGGGSLAVSNATGKTSTVKGGTVETGELHSVLEPLRRASRWRFLYSSRETWEDAEPESQCHLWTKSMTYVEPVEGSMWAVIDTKSREGQWISWDHYMVNRGWHRIQTLTNLDFLINLTCYILHSLLIQSKKKKKVCLANPCISCKTDEYIPVCCFFV